MMKQMNITKDGLSILWYAICEDANRIDPNTGRITPRVQITGATQSRASNKLLAAIEDHFPPNGEMPIDANGVWKFYFEDAQPVLFVIAEDVFALAKAFWESLVRTRLNTNRKSRALVEAVDVAFEAATEYKIKAVAEAPAQAEA